MATSGLEAEHQPLRVLVVEDESLLRWAIVETLTRAGHTVIEAWDAATAMRALVSEPPGVDVVLLDYRLPDSNDLKLLSTLRRLSPASAVVMMTAHATPETVASALELGAHNVLTKPFDIGDLNAELWKACGARPHRAGE